MQEVKTVMLKVEKMAAVMAVVMKMMISPECIQVLAKVLLKSKRTLTDSEKFLFLIISMVIDKGIFKEAG